MSLGIQYGRGSDPTIGFGVNGQAPNRYIKHGPLFEQGAFAAVGMTAYPSGRGPYFPSVINVRNLVQGGHLTLASEIANANYLMYVSEDHGSISGIWLATAPAITGPWTVVSGTAGSGRIFDAPGAGSGQETPEVFYSYAQQKLIMVSHSVGLGNEQSSRLSYSTDGLNWSNFSPDIVLDVPIGSSGPFVSDGHTGYIRHHRLNNGQSMFNGIVSGTTNSRRISWYSHDDLVWETAPGLMSINTEARYSDIEDRGAFPYSYCIHQNRLYGIGVHQSFTSGAGATASGDMWLFGYDRPSSNLLRAEGGPILRIPRGDPGDIDDLFYLSPKIISDNGRLYIITVCRQYDATLDKNYIMLVELK